MIKFLLPGLLALGFTAAPAAAASCDMCAAWNRPHEPFRLYGNAYYVGTAALTSILIVSDAGDILIDGDHTDSPPQIAANIKKLGFRIEDVRVILNTHAHVDHAGGIAALQRLSHAVVKASPASASALEAGAAQAGDPQFGSLPSFPAVHGVEVIADGDVVRVGPLALTAHFTPGHTPGGTTWTWDSCEGARCLHMVYLDSLSAVSAPAFKFSRRPATTEDFAKSFRAVAALPCDIAISAHPEASNFWERLTRRDHGEADALIDANACRAYSESAKAALAKRIAAEAKP